MAFEVSAIASFYVASAISGGQFVLDLTAKGPVPAEPGGKIVSIETMKTILNKDGSVDSTLTKEYTTYSKPLKDGYQEKSNSTFIYKNGQY